MKTTLHVYNKPNTQSTLNVVDMLICAFTTCATSLNRTKSMSLTYQHTTNWPTLSQSLFPAINSQNSHRISSNDAPNHSQLCQQCALALHPQVHVFNSVAQKRTTTQRHNGLKSSMTSSRSYYGGVPNTTPRIIVRCYQIDLISGSPRIPNRILVYLSIDLSQRSARTYDARSDAAIGTQHQTCTSVR